MSEHLHQAVEYTICQHSPQYFFQKYLSQAFKYRGFDYQNLDYHTDWYTSTDPVLYLRSARHTGSTVSTVARLVWELVFKTNNKSAVIGKTHITAEIMNYVRMCIERLPEWLQPKLEVCNRTYIYTESKNTLIVGGSTNYTLRGHSINNLYLVDIQLFKPYEFEEIVMDAWPSLISNQGRILFTSSGRVDITTLIKVSDFNPTVLFAGWDTLPGCDENYRTNHIRQCGEEYWEQHFELSVP